MCHHCAMRMMYAVDWMLCLRPCINISLPQVVDGNRLIVTPYDLSFRRAQEHAVLCTKNFDKKEVQQFRKVRSYRSLC